MMHPYIALTRKNTIIGFLFLEGVLKQIVVNRGPPRQARRLPLSPRLRLRGLRVEVRDSVDRGRLLRAFGGGV